MKLLISKTILLGVTGLIGQEVAQQSEQPLTCFSRRPVPDLPDRHQLLVSNSLLDINWPSDIDTVICCLGSTLKKAGSKKAFIDQDYELPVKLFENALANGAKRLFLITAIGSNSSSLSFYNRVKGKLELQVSKQEWQQITIFRPSLLIGKRTDVRLAEQIAQFLTSRLSRVFPAKIRPISSENLASSILSAVNDPPKLGQFIIEGKKLWNR